MKYGFFIFSAVDCCLSDPRAELERAMVSWMDRRPPYPLRHDPIITASWRGKSMVPRSYLVHALAGLSPPSTYRACICHFSLRHARSDLRWIRARSLRWIPAFERAIVPWMDGRPPDPLCHDPIIAASWRGKKHGSSSYLVHAPAGLSPPSGVPCLYVSFFLRWIRALNLRCILTVKAKKRPSVAGRSAEA